MNTKVGIVTLAFTIVTALTVAAAPQASTVQSARSANVYQMRMDACPYYPSPVVCHANSSNTATD
jgi:hypothetical protein